MNLWVFLLVVILIFLIVGVVTWGIISIINSTNKPTSNMSKVGTRTNLNNSSSGYEVQFVNQSGQMLLLGALGPSIVLPREGTWELPNGGILNIDIPSSWLNTAGNSSLIGPRFWARTGCRYNIHDDKAQCETGSCGGAYNCSKANLAGNTPTSLAEFCFQCGNGLTYYDVSLVDGYNLSINIEPVGSFSPTNPNNPNDVFWCKSDTCNKGQDLRSICPATHQLYSSQIPSYIPGQPNNIIGCFSNCGLFEYPTAPAANCDEKTDPKCAGWRKYCCQAADFGKPCNSDNDCSNGGACWTGNDRPISPNNPATCQCRAYYLNPPCPPTVCTNPEAAPNAAACHSSAGGTAPCIGDDIMHKICPRSYTWPNDGQTYDCSSKRYRVTFSPGGTPVPVTPVSKIPKCSSLPSNFDYITAAKNCSQVPGKYACAVIPSKGNWACNVDAPNVGCNGVICERDTPPPPTNIPKCNTLPPQYNPNKGIQDCSIPNRTNKYNCAVSGNNSWACGIPQSYVCTGVVCEA